MGRHRNARGGGNISPTGEILVYAKRVALSSADILALSSTPIELVAAPGPNKQIIFHGVTVWFTAGGTPYSAGSNIRIYYTSLAAARYVSSWANTEWQSAVDRVQSYGTSTMAWGYAPPGNLINAPLVLTVDSSDFTSGDGTAVLVIEYTIECTT